jgi:N-acetylmuramoyl-L-alanine amidase
MQPAALAFLAVLLLAALAVPATGLEVVGLRWFSAPDHTRVVLDLDGPGHYQVREVADPPRLAVDVASATFRATDPVAIADGLVQRLRRNALRTKAQVVLDLEQAAEFRHFALPAVEGRPHRVVVDVLRDPAGAVVEPERMPVPGRAIRVIIDPGHGGLDPGALRGSTQEKDIVLDVSLRLRDILNATPGHEAILTRDRDWYPSLADRVTTASAQDGDLFVSIHCNTHRRSSVRGMEVYFLSLQGATDREAQELADKENAADLVGLAPGADHDDAVMSILMDLHMTRVLHRSSQLAEEILAATARRGLATRRVKQARFQVLRSLAMPSALVELAYLTNREDRRLLLSADGRQQLAQAVADGLVAYHGDQGPVVAAEPDWSRHYKVQRGDNLWRLARRHGTTVLAIRERNNLRSDRIRAGQYLSLPEGRPGS